MPLADGITLQPHQRWLADTAKQHLERNEPFKQLLLWNLGSGKGGGSLAAAHALGKPYSAIVPAALRETLKHEERKFTDQSIPSEILSYNKLTTGYQPPHAETLIFDEAGRLGRPTKQTRAATNLATPDRNVILLSGTPIQNDPEEFTNIYNILTQNNFSPEEFRQKYIANKELPQGFFSRLFKGPIQSNEEEIINQDELKASLAGKVDYYAPAKPVVPTTYQDIETEMSPGQASIYKGMWQNLPWLLRLKLKYDYGLSRDDLQRLKSFLTGPRQVGLSELPFQKNPDPYKAFQSSGKLTRAYQELNNTLSSDPNKKAIIYSNFIRAGLDPYAEALSRNKIPYGMFYGGMNDVERKKMVEDFNANKLRVALVGPAGSEGISLKGAQLIQLLDPHWHESRSRQAEGRGLRHDSHLHLPEDLRNVTIQRYISKLPLTTKQKMLELLGFDQSHNQLASDNYLRDLAAKKERLNKQFIDILKEVGTKKASELEWCIKASNYVPEVKEETDEQKLEKFARWGMVIPKLFNAVKTLPAKLPTVPAPNLTALRQVPSAVKSVAAPVVNTATKATTGYVKDLAGYGAQGPLQGQNVLRASTVKPYVGPETYKAMKAVGVPEATIAERHYTPGWIDRNVPGASLVSALGNDLNRNKILHPIIQSGRTVANVLSTPVISPINKLVADKLKQKGFNRTGAALSGADSILRGAVRVGTGVGIGSGAVGAGQAIWNAPYSQQTKLLNAVDPGKDPSQNTELQSAATNPFPALLDGVFDNSELANVGRNIGRRYTVPRIQDAAHHTAKNMRERVNPLKYLSLSSYLTPHVLDSVGKPMNFDDNTIEKEEIEKGLPKILANYEQEINSPTGKRLLRLLDRQIDVPNAQLTYSNGVVASSKAQNHFLRDRYLQNIVPQAGSLAFHYKYPYLPSLEVPERIPNMASTAANSQYVKELVAAYINKDITRLAELLKQSPEQLPAQDQPLYKSLYTAYLKTLDNEKQRQLTALDSTQKELTEDAQLFGKVNLNAAKLHAAQSASRATLSTAPMMFTDGGPLLINAVNDPSPVNIIALGRKALEDPKFRERVVAKGGDIANMEYEAGKLKLLERVEANKGNYDNVIRQDLLRGVGRHLGTEAGKVVDNVLFKASNYVPPTEDQFAVTLDQLRQAKQYSDNRQYGAKTNSLRQLMKAAPDEWVIDSVQDHTVGLTHVPTRWRFHLPKYTVSDIQLNMQKQAGTLYHGSNIPDLKTIEPRPSRVLDGESAVFGTPDKDLALTFLSKWNDDDFAQGYVNGKPYMQEKYEGAFDKIYGGKSGTLYEMDDNNSKVDPRLMRLERIFNQPQPVSNSTLVADILEALKKTRFNLTKHDGTPLTKSANDSSQNIVGANNPQGVTQVPTTQNSSPAVMSGFQLEKPKGTYKQFRDPTDPVLKNYPIEGVTYPTDYGYLPSHVGEDDDDLDLFRGSGQLYGAFRVSRPDAKGGAETKFLAGLTPEEYEAVTTAFKPVLAGDPETFDQNEFLQRLEAFRRPQVPTIGEHELVIDRPKGFEKTFPRRTGR